MRILLTISISVISLFAFFLHSQEKVSKYNILLSGASFATENNGWVEIAYEVLDAKPINRAIGVDRQSRQQND